MSKEFSRVNNDIHMTLADVDREIDKWGQLSSRLFGGRTNPLVNDFGEHLHDLKNSADHLYSAFN